MSADLEKSPSETRLRIILQATLTTAILGGVGFIDEKHKLLQETIRIFAPLIGFVVGVFADYWVRVFNYKQAEKKILQYISECENKTKLKNPQTAEDLIYWSKKLQEHRATNMVKIDM